MTVGQIANSVASFHNKERSDFVDVLGEDLIIAAMNEARKELERDYDFFYQQTQVWLSVDPTSGALLTSAKLFDGTAPDVGDAAVSVKSVETAYMYAVPSQGSSAPYSLIPVWADSKKLLANRVRERSYRYGGVNQPRTYDYHNYPFTRYPGYYSDNTQRALRLFFHGGRVQFDPRFADAQYLVMDVSAWMNEYVADDVIVVASSTASTSITLAATPTNGFTAGSTFLGQLVIGGAGTSWTLGGNANETITHHTRRRFTRPLAGASATGEGYTDWLTERGSDYLKWHAVCAMNYIVPSFVPRQSGSIAPPEKARDTAKASLYEWDVFLWESGRSPNAVR